MASQIMVANETTSRSTRMTKDGRKITYQMNVIQQPERARACGSGAKSSADRRPVDPPPIVELRIYEGEAMQNDITFAYNANFFLFATLENARNIAQGRVPTSNAFPVLTGTPVAGMAYLDRPNPAGYFIFPDLSVRHEGKYRLSFALYEELKEQKDMDSEQDQSQIEEIRVRGIDAHVSHRLEVKSAPFTVFSAKKFPGLTESTALSRMVAEQGCRVRIRRDVRMRRRDNKSKDWDDYDGEDHYERARRTATPDGYQSAIPTPQTMADGSDRPRSVSNASIASFGPPQRRPSMQEMAQAYQQGGYQQPPMPPPHTPQSGYPAQIPYGTPQTHQYQNQYTPTQQQQPPMMPPQQPPYQPPQHAYQQQPQPQMPLSQGYGYVQQQQYSPQDPSHAARQDGMEYPSAPTAYRRASGTMLHPPQHPEQYTNGASQMPQPVPSWSAHQNPYNPQPKYEQSPPGMPPVQAPPQQTSMAPAATSMTLPSSTQPLAPLKTLQPVMEKPLASSPYAEQPPQMPMGWAPEYGDQSQNPYAAMRKQTAVSSQASAPSSAVTETTPAYNQFPPPKFPSTTQQQHSPQQYPNGGAVGGTKRSFASTFDTNHVTQPLRQGARPDVASAHSPTEGAYNNRHGFDGMDDDLEDNFVENAAMSYRRADGTERRRRVPLTS